MPISVFLMESNFFKFSVLQENLKEEGEEKKKYLFIVFSLQLFLALQDLRER